jgi:uncharacterized membrane protein
MQEVLLVLGLWLSFGVTHVGLATRRVRELLVSRLSELGFGWSYTLVASVLFAALVAAYSQVRFSGPRGFALAEIPWVRAPLLAANVAGVSLMIGALAPSGYWDSPAAILRDGVRPAHGLERITRHPFFTGLTLVMGSHALLATRMTGTIFFTGFVLLASLGPMHQARKLRARKGEQFVRYLEHTSALPFVAIAQGRQSLVLREMPWGALVLGVVLAFAVQQVHDGIFAWHGAPLTGAVVGGSILIGLISTWRQQRAQGKEPQWRPQ